MAVQRALVSVSDKTGLVELVTILVETWGYEIVSTGGTAAALSSAGLPVTMVSDVTAFPEMLEGRVKTLHPAIHGGLLADRSKPEHMEAINSHGIIPIDMVIVNLYPFAQTISKPGVTREEAIENIDIGGPSMVRSAAKNHASVTVVVSSDDYVELIDELSRGRGETSPAFRARMAGKAFAHTGAYDATIAAYLRKDEADFPDTLPLGFEKVQDLRYGENPHQQAAFYRETGPKSPGVTNATKLNGKELSFNNIFDLNAAYEIAQDFASEPQPFAAIIKHTNPCGCALAATLDEAFRLARAGDPISAFGGILSTSKPIDSTTAELITGPNTFFEAIIAPGYSTDAIEILTTRKKWGLNLILLATANRTSDQPLGLDFKRVSGGLLVQHPDVRPVTAADLVTGTRRGPTEDEIENLLFAWKVVKHVKSNAIVIARDGRLLGVGAGQMNRVQSVRLAVAQAGDAARGAVLASDAFFPFADGPDAAGQAGITAIIQPGGSKKDDETIAMADTHNIAMVFTGARHFRH